MKQRQDGGRNSNSKAEREKHEEATWKAKTEDEIKERNTRPRLKKTKNKKNNSCRIERKERHKRSEESKKGRKKKKEKKKARISPIRIS